MGFKHLLLDVDERTAVVTINRPAALNALNTEVLEELSSVLTDIQGDQSVDCVILTGCGTKAFVAGADIASMQSMDAVSAENFARFGQKVFNKIESFSKPVIAAVNGFALGGGCELAMACDVRLVAANASFGQPEVTLGVIPGFGGTSRLARLVGKGRAKELIFTGDLIDASEAYRIGLANKVVAAEELLAEAKKMASKIVSKGKLAVCFAKQAVNNGSEMELEQAGRLEAALLGFVSQVPTRRKGCRLFWQRERLSLRDDK